MSGKALKMTTAVASNSHRIWGSERIQRWIVPLALFLLAFLPRAIYPLTRTDLWLNRAYRFGHAILSQDWAATYQQYHPGVSLMWLSSLGIETFLRGQGPITDGQFYGHVPVTPGLLAEASVAGLLPVVFAISIAIALTYPLLSRLSGRRIALVSGILLALDPFHITYSKTIHVDALLASFMILSALFLLVYLRDGRGHNLAFSGFFGGLSFLTKSPAVFLVPYAGLIVAVTYFGRQLSSNNVRRTKPFGRAVGQSARTLVIWALIAAATFFLLFPAMWVQPGQVLAEIWASMTLHVNRAHINPVFFAGRLWESDPGIPFHLAVIVWKTTALTLPLIAVAVLFALRRLRAPESRTLWAMIAYVLFFILQMGLADKKQMAYILPAFPALNIIAAYGLVWSAEALSNIGPGQPRPWQPTAIIALALAVQAILVLRHHPYYGVQHNLLLGGSPAAAQVLPLQDQGEGLDLAAKFLNELPYVRDKKAAVHWRNEVIFRHRFAGSSVGTPDAGADFRVYGLNSVMRDFLGSETWQTAWQQDQQNEPLFTVDFDGVRYVWVYGDVPHSPAEGGPVSELDAWIGQDIQLSGLELSADRLTPGETLAIVLEWQSHARLQTNYKVFIHLLSSEGDLVAQSDSFPLHGVRPTYTWDRDETLYDAHSLAIPEALPPGEYLLLTGMYDPETLERQSAFDAMGRRLDNDSIPLATLLAETAGG